MSKKWLTAAVLSMAVGSVVLPGISFAQEGVPATQPAAAQQADVPVKAVVLFSSGVGYFEHFGSIKGDGSTELRFKTNQINDILKSLILQDLDGGHVNTIQYPSQDPIAKTLSSFQVDISGNPPLAELLNQLRGAKVSIVGAEGNLEGIILGAESRPVPVPQGSQPISEWVVNLLGRGTIRQINLNKLTSITLVDKKLQDELDRALAALSQARDQDKKPVTINFTGQGERRVRLGYVVETPIWKTSYRLILNAPGEAKKGEDGKAGALPPTVSKLQGWAIVENQTDNDWTNVQLSLVSGRPISFVQDLYQPLYIPRPVVKPELYASLKPQTYEGGVDKENDEKAADFSMSGKMGAAPAATPARKAESNKRFRGGMGGGGDAAVADRMVMQEAMDQPMDASTSVQSIASASKMGELFQYTVGNVSLPRQKSAMIPIITDDIEVEKLSIYNQSVLAKNPLNGARLKNTTKNHLLQGPITVLDANSYAGDARIDNVPPGQERLLSYGIDLQMTVDATQHKQDGSLLSGKIVKGVLILTNKSIDEQTYLADNKSDNEKTLVIEHPRLINWKLIDGDSKPIETTDALYRFKGKVAAGKASKLVVKQELVTNQAIAIMNSGVDELLIYSRRGEIDPKVRDAITDVIAKKQAMEAINQQIAERNAKLSRYPGEQQRIRENIKIFDPQSDSRRKLQAKLDKQETDIETLQSEIGDLQKQQQQKQAEFEKSLEGLNVG